MRRLKVLVSWVLVACGAVGVGMSYWSVWVLVAYFAAGLAWWANVALFFSGPLAGGGAIVAFIKPRQKVALVLGSLAVGAWILLWVMCFTLLGFEVL